jgi:hypothetical protein
MLHHDKSEALAAITAAVELFPAEEDLKRLMQEISASATTTK